MGYYYFFTSRRNFSMRMLARSRVIMRRSGVKLLHGEEVFFSYQKPLPTL